LVMTEQHNLLHLKNQLQNISQYKYEEHHEKT
jgi:hypothetical protein